MVDEKIQGVRSRKTKEVRMGVIQIITIAILNFSIFIILLALKLCEVIAMSWLWVTSPLWLPQVVLSALIIGAVTVEVFKR